MARGDHADHACRGEIYRSPDVITSAFQACVCVLEMPYRTTTRKDVSAVIALYKAKEKVAEIEEQLGFNKRTV